VIAVMVGGPLHGHTRDLGPRPPHIVLIPRKVEPAVLAEQPRAVETTQQPHVYELCWYDAPNRGWRGEQRKQLAYLCIDDPAPIRLPDRPSEDDVYFAGVAESLWHNFVESKIPICVVPDCTDKGRLTFVAAERGRLAGQDWNRGDEIQLCPEHGRDVYVAAGARGMDQLAEWLRPDAMWDPLDAYDAGSAWYLNRTARSLRLARKS
jgi:hypothetical protein